jgi:hypothetical protein
MLRFGSDWWTEQTILDFASLEQMEAAQPLGELDLAIVVEEVDRSCNSEEGSYSHESSNWGGQVFVHGSHAYVPRYRDYYKESTAGYKWTRELTFFVVDLSDRTNPEVIGSVAVDPVDGQNNE